MARTETNEVDEALASGEVYLLKARLIDPTDELKALFKSMGRTKTNFIYEEDFEGGRPFIVIIFSKELIKALMGATVAAERWQQQTVLFPLRSMTIGTINCLTRILDDDLKSNMPGLESCSEAGKKYWKEHFERAKKEGFYDEEEVTRTRTDLDPQILKRLIACLFRDELSVYCFASPMYDRDAVDARRPVVQGEEHAITLDELVEHLRAQISRITKADVRWKALTELESIDTDERVWVDKVETASKARAAAAASAPAVTPGPIFGPAPKSAAAPAVVAAPTVTPSPMFGPAPKTASSQPAPAPMSAINSGHGLDRTKKSSGAKGSASGGVLSSVQAGAAGVTTAKGGVKKGKGNGAAQSGGGKSSAIVIDDDDDMLDEDELEYVEDGLENLYPNKKRRLA